LETALFEANKQSHTKSEIVPVLQRQDYALIDTLFNIARISRKRRRQAMRVFDRVYAAAGSKQFESTVMFHDFVRELEGEKTLGRDELAHLRTAFHDWVTARQLFESLYTH